MYTHQKEYLEDYETKNESNILINKYFNSNSENSRA